MVKVISKALRATTVEISKVQPLVRLLDYMNPIGRTFGKTLIEFADNEEFINNWYERQRREVYAGMASEPMLYDEIYNIVSDTALPRNVSIYRLSPNGVTFETVMEGGEVKFCHPSPQNPTIQIRQVDMSLPYSMDFLVFNEMWSLPIVERSAGAFYGALKNHIHLAPFLMTDYPESNRTMANGEGETRSLRYLRTFEDAMVHAALDQANPRRGSFALLVSSANVLAAERALMGETAPSLIGRIEYLISYDGWTGRYGDNVINYEGVKPGKAYLINLAFKEQDHQSFEKISLQVPFDDKKNRRFILEGAPLESYFGTYCNPLASTEEISLPD